MSDPIEDLHARRWLLVTDVDDTFLGDVHALHRLVEIDAATPELAIVLNSSRPIDSVAKTIAAELPGWRPAATIGALGTEIEIGGTRVVAWAGRFETWDREPIDRVMERVGGVPHDAEYQTPLKASFTVGNEDRAAAFDGIRLLNGRCKVVVSGAGNFDVIPADAGKAAPLPLLVEALGPRVHRTITAGDSGNDVELITAGDGGIVVGNASEELRAAVTGRAGVYEARATHAAGIIEGLHHFGAPLGGDDT